MKGENRMKISVGNSGKSGFFDGYFLKEDLYVITEKL